MGHVFQPICTLPDTAKRKADLEKWTQCHGCVLGLELYTWLPNSGYLVEGKSRTEKESQEVKSFLNGKAKFSQSIYCKDIFIYKSSMCYHCSKSTSQISPTSLQRVIIFL